MSGLFDRLQDELDESGKGQKSLSPIDLLDLPPALATIIKKIIRKNGLELAEIAQELDQSLEETQELLSDLVAKGYVRQVKVQDKIWYKAHFGRKTDKPLSSGVWSALDSVIDQDQTGEEK